MIRLLFTWNKLPKKEQEVPVTENYTVTVAGDYPYINNQNETDVNIKIELEEELSKTEEFTLELEGVQKSDGKTKTKATVKVKIPANTSEVTVAENADSTKDIIQWVSGGINVKSTEWKNGEIKGTLKNSKGTVVSEFTIEKYSTTPEAANVVATRTLTQEYSFSLDTLSEYPLANVYYYRIDYQSGNSDAGETASTPADSVAGMFENGTKLSCTNGSLNAKITDKTMNEELASTLYYVLEDVYGNRTTGGTVPSTIITADRNATKGEVATNVTAPALTSPKGSAEFTFTGVDTTEKYTVKVYYKATASATPELIDEQTGITTTSTAGTTTGFGSLVVDELKKPGFYYAEVITEATATKKASDPVKSAEIEVKQMPAVKDLKYVESNKVSWDNADYKDITANFDKVNIEIVRLDDEAITSEAVASGNQANLSTITTTEVGLDNLTAGVIYKIKATVKAKDTIGYIDSEEVETDAFFLLGTTSVKTVGNTTITLANVPDVKVNDESASFDVELIRVEKGTSGALVEKETITKSNLKADKDGNLVIPDLQAGASYRIRLKCTAADGTTATSGWLPTTTTTYVRTLPQISGTIAKAGETTGIYSDGSSKIVIDGTEYLATEYAQSGATFTTMASVINALKEKDKITLDLDNSAVNIEFNEETEGDALRNFGTNLKDYTVTLKSHGVTREVTITGAKDVILESGYFEVSNITSVESESVTCKNGVNIVGSGTTTLKVLAGATVTMDKIDVKPSLDTTMRCASGTLDIDMVSGENNISVLNNQKSNITVNFVAGRDVKSQAGSVTVENGGDVTISATGGTVTSAMDITVTDGNVDLSAKEVAGGEKTITVNTTDATEKTVKGYAANKLDESIASEFTTAAVEDIDLSEEFDLEDNATWNNITTKITAWNDKDANADKIKTFIKYLQDNFGSLIGRSVTITIDQTTAKADGGYPLITLKLTENTEEADDGEFIITGLR